MIIRDGRPLARIEIVLPRWRDVLRHKLRQATSQPRHRTVNSSDLSGTTNEASEQTTDDVGIEMDPDEDSRVPMAEPEQHNAARLAGAIQDLRNVSKGICVDP